MASFTQGELEVMQVLWEGEQPLKPAEIQELFPRPIRNAALRSVLLVLLDKGHVKRKRIGKAYYYQAAVPRETAIAKMARRMAEAFCGGSSAALIAHLIRSEKLSEEDIRELRRVASSRMKRRTSSKKGGHKS